jgi:PAS domain-containing protein
MKEEHDRTRRRYQALFKCVPDPYLMTDLHGRIVEVAWSLGLRLRLGHKDRIPLCNCRGTIPA